MRLQKKSMQSVNLWLKRQPLKVKAFLAVVSGMAALVVLRSVVSHSRKHQKRGLPCNFRCCCSFGVHPRPVSGGVILPYLQRLTELDDGGSMSYNSELTTRENPQERRKSSDMDFQREDECGICLEPCTKIVLPNCCHSMCINYYRDWNLISESCSSFLLR